MNRPPNWNVVELVMKIRDLMSIKIKIIVLTLYWLELPLLLTINPPPQITTETKNNSKMIINMNCCIKTLTHSASEGVGG